jgi:hypothetical protein
VSPAPAQERRAPPSVAYASFPSSIADTSQLKFALPDFAEAAQRSGHHAAAADIARRSYDLPDLGL